ncbi:MAG: outer membrane protein assembly factor BamD [Thermodesulfobacteriota bacterium]
MMNVKGILRVAAVTVLLPFFLASCFKEVVPEVDLSAEELYSKGMAAYHNGLSSESGAYFKRVMDEHPLDRYAVDSQLMLGELHYKMANYEDAAAYYTTFVSMHPGHIKAPYAFFQKGMSHFKLVLASDRDQIETEKALFAFEDFVKSYPDSPYMGKAGELMVFLKRRLAESEFKVGKFYFKMKSYRGALARFMLVLKDYPDVGFTDETLYYVGRSYALLGEEGLATETFTTLVKEFPESPFARKAKKKFLDG